MKKEKYKMFVPFILLATVAVCVAAGSLFVTMNSWKSLNDSNLFVPQPQENGQGTAYTEEVRSGSLALSFSADGLKANNPTVLLGTRADCVAVSFPEGEYAIEYDMESGYFSAEVDGGKLVVQKISADEIYGDCLRLLATESGEELIAGQKIISADAGISVVGILQNSEKRDDILALAEYVMTNTTLGDKSVQLSIENFKVNDNWAQSITVDKSVVSFGNGEEDIIMSRFTNSLTGAGFTNSFEPVEGMKVSCGSFQDAATGYKPYMFTADSGTLKIMAKNTENLENAFATTEQKQL